MAVTASAAGICFASGRTVALFFSQTGRASWAGIAAASVVFGAVCFGSCHTAQKTGVSGVLSACMRILGSRAAAALGGVYGALMLAVGIAMLNAAGDLAALALPVGNADRIGVLTVLCASLLLCMKNMRLMKSFGMLTLGLSTLFFIGQALDPRPVRYYRSFEAMSVLDGSLTAAVGMGILFGALCGIVCADMAAGQVREAGQPILFGFRCGAVLFLMLAPVNFAVLRCGSRILSCGIPTAVLAARWGKFGFYACITVMQLCVIATFTAVLGSLKGRQNMTKKRDNRITFT